MDLDDVHVRGGGQSGAGRRDAMRSLAPDGRGRTPVRNFLQGHVMPLKAALIAGVLGLMVGGCGREEPVKGATSPETRHALQQKFEELSRHIASPESGPDRPFLMPIEDVFEIAGRGCVVTGSVMR